MAGPGLPGLLQEVLQGGSIRFTELISSEKQAPLSLGPAASTATAASASAAAVADASVVDYDEIVQLTKRTKKERATGGRRTRDSTLPDALLGHMGEANKAFVNQQYDEAIRLCNHVIEKHPYAADPYTTLAMVHLDRGDLKASLEFRKLEAICLDNSDVDWERLGQMSLQTGNVAEAAHFYTEAFKKNPLNASAAYELGRLYHRDGYMRKAFDMYAAALRANPDAVEVWQRLTQLAVKPDGNAFLIEIIQALKAAFSSLATVTKDHVMSLAHLQITANFHLDALQLIIAHMTVCIETGEAFAPALPVVHAMGGVVVPPDLCSNVRLLLGLAHVHVPVGQPFAVSILESFKCLQDGSSLGTHVRIIDAFLEGRLYEEGLAYTNFLLQTEQLARPFLHFKRAKCIVGLGCWADAVPVLTEVLANQPANKDAMKLLAQSYDKLGDRQNARMWRIRADPKSKSHSSRRKAAADGRREITPKRSVKSSVDSTTINSDKTASAHGTLPRALPLPMGNTGLQDCPLPNRACASTSQPLHKSSNKAYIKSDFEMAEKAIIEGRLHETLDIGWKLITCLLMPVGEGSRKRKAESIGEQFDHIPKLPTWPDVRFKGNNNPKLKRPIVEYAVGSDEQGDFNPSDISSEQWIMLARGVIEVLCERQQFDDALAIVVRILGDKQCSLHSVGIVQEEEDKSLFLWILANLQHEQGDRDNAVKTMRVLVRRVPKSMRLWNRFYEVHRYIGSPQSLQRFLLRVIQRERDITQVHPAVFAIAGDHHLQGGNLSFAAANFLAAHQLQPTEPLLLLCVGATFLQMVMQRRPIDRHLFAIQAFTYLFMYAKMRGKDTAEVNYNLGRAYHHLKLVDVACRYYEVVLEYGGAYTFEAAHNLGRIYTESGSPHRARQLLAKYCVI